MKTIEIEDNVYSALLAKVQDFGETPNEVLGRILDPLDLVEAVVECEEEASDFDAFCQSIENSHRTGITRYIAVLGYLYRKTPELFEHAALSIRGTRRQYIAKSKIEILRVGNSTMPKEIHGTPYYAVGNLSKRLMLEILERVMLALGHDLSQISKIKRFVRCS